MFINNEPTILPKEYNSFDLPSEHKKSPIIKSKSSESLVSENSLNSSDTTMSKYRSLSIGSITPYANLNYEDCNLEFDNAPDYNVDSIINICVKTIKSWFTISRSDIIVKQITAGTSSIIYSVEHKSKAEDIYPKKALFRIYSPKVKELYDESIENEVFEAMANHNLGPKLIGYTCGGRIEEWIDGCILSYDMLHDINVLKNIAKLISVLHRTIHPNYAPSYWDRRPALINYINRWSNASLKGPDIIQKIVNLKNLIREKNIYCKALTNYVKDNFSFPFNLAFCHNDLHENNIIAESKTGNYRLIDFEYSGFNYLACDIANIILESSIEYNADLPLKYKVHYNKPMPESTQRNFISFYISFMKDTNVNSDDEIVDTFLNADLNYTGDFGASYGMFFTYTHHFFSLRSLAGPSKKSSLDYVKFANENFMMYMKTKISTCPEFAKYLEEAEKEYKEEK